MKTGKGRRKETFLVRDESVQAFLCNDWKSCTEGNRLLLRNRRLINGESQENDRVRERNGSWRVEGEGEKKESRVSVRTNKSV